MKKFLSVIFLLTLIAGWGFCETGKTADNHIVTDKKAVQANDIAQAETQVQAVNLAEQYQMASDFVLIRKSEFTVYAVDAKGDIVASYGCALGKNPGQKEREGDMKTPDGVFTIDEIIASSWWTHDFKDGKGEIAGAYGPWFISLDTTNLSGGRWGGIGIHGTHAPDSIGTLASEGCIRLNNADIERLKQFVKVGMKVVIEE